MPWLRITLLIAAMLATSGYRFRCYLACVDQTGTQNDYVEQRDYCREYAQLKAGMAMREGGTEDKSRKSTLVSLFSQCMGNNGWTVPDGKGEGPPKKLADAVPPAAILSQASTGAPAPTAAAKAEEKSAMTRTVECAFARNSVSVSSIAKTRAEACDLECAEGLRTAPNAPRPPSCPSDLSAKLAKGNEE